MVEEVERYAKQDELFCQRMVVRNGLESYTQNLKNTVADARVVSKIPTKRLMDRVYATLDWMNEEP